MPKQEPKNKIQKTEDNQYFISKYNDDPATELDIVNACKSISVCFDVTNDYIALLADRMIAFDFTKQRVQDAVNHVISNCKYPKPTIAQFLSFDKKQRLYNYQQYCRMTQDGVQMKSVKINDKPYWVEV